MAAQLHDLWKAKKDQHFRELVEVGKSWVLISAILKRSIKRVQDRHRLLKRRSDQVGAPCFAFKIHRHRGMGYHHPQVPR